MPVPAEPAPRPLRLATWHGGEGDRVRIAPLHLSPVVSLGTFWCPPDDVRWLLENFVGEVAHIILPATPVWIAVQGREPALAGPKHAMFFNRGDARAVGFSSQSHLTASFHRAVGIPPSCVKANVASVRVVVNGGQSGETPRRGGRGRRHRIHG